MAEAGGLALTGAVVWPGLATLPGAVAVGLALVVALLLVAVVLARRQEQWMRHEVERLRAARVMPPADALTRAQAHIEELEAEKARLEAALARSAAELDQTRARLAERAVTDELTGLPSRRSILEQAGHSLAYARRHRSPLAVALLDVDHLREVNETLGHQAGDALLVKLATALRTALRNEDLVGRYGGDEILVLLPGTGMTGALHAGERLRSAASVTPVSVGPSELPPFATTVSVGVTTIRPEDDNVEAVVRRAEDALGSAKAAGRNRVEVV